jgi:hypothetical protein
MNKFFSVVSCGVHELSGLGLQTWLKEEDVKPHGQYLERSLEFIQKRGFFRVMESFLAPVVQSHIANHQTGHLEPQTAEQLRNSAQKRSCAFYVYSDPVCFGAASNGETFTRLIREHNLGEVIETPTPRVNPNSRNPIKVYVWAHDSKAIAAWVKAETVKVKAEIEAERPEVKSVAKVKENSNRAKLPADDIIEYKHSTRTDFTEQAGRRRQPSIRTVTI